MENHHAVKNGKPSISIRAIEKPWRTVNVITRGYLFTVFTLRSTIILD